MKHMTEKKNSEQLIQEFLARGGKITKCPPAMPKPSPSRPVSDTIVVEIEVEHLPLELRKLLKD